MDSSKQFYDERYEFDAPQQYIDFSNFQDDDAEDSFFGKFSHDWIGNSSNLLYI